jgi:hypothetical protein
MVATRAVEMVASMGVKKADSKVASTVLMKALRTVDSTVA